MLFFDMSQINKQRYRIKVLEKSWVPGYNLAILVSLLIGIILKMKLKVRFGKKNLVFSFFCDGFDQNEVNLRYLLPNVLFQVFNCALF